MYLNLQTNNKARFFLNTYNFVRLKVNCNLLEINTETK